MSGRREDTGLPTRTRWAAGATALALAGATLTLALLPAESAGAKTVHANYHAGSDKAVFTLTGVEDSNCLISTGGSTVYIKPGDRIDFSSGLAGIALNGLDLQGGQLTGLNVTAKIDGGTKKGGETFTVRAGKTVKVRDLPAGTHQLSWSASSIGVHIPAKTILKKVPIVGGLVHKVVPAHGITIPLSSSQLKSGAKMSWSGKIFVTKNAPRCTISVQTPKTKVSAGPLHVTVPGQNVTVPGATVPTKISGVPNLNPSKSKAPSSTSSSGSSGYTFAPQQQSVPEMVVPKGNTGDVYGGGSGYDLGASGVNGVSGAGTNGGSSTQLTHGSGTQSGDGHSATTSRSSDGSASTPTKKTVDLASDATNSSLADQVPVILAIVAVVVLALVAGTYARLYLLGRKR